MDCWFEFDDGQNGPQGDIHNLFTSADRGATLQNFTTTGGVKKKAKYRWPFRKEASAAQPDDDYSSLFTLVDAMNGDITGADYAARMPMLADVENWAQMFAIRQFTCAWDCYGSYIGKNSHLFKPGGGPWKMTLWDMSQGLGAAGPWFVNSQHDAALFVNVEDPVISDKFYQHPPFRRAFLSTVKEAVNGPMKASVCGPRMDEYYRGLTNNGIAVQSPTPGAANNGASAAGHLYISEWMARNTSTIADPADGEFDDWFELYNADPEPMDLTGFQLAGNLRTNNVYKASGGTMIPGHGYLLVWANSRQTTAGSELYVNFGLNRTGDTIAVYAPDGALVDSVVFGPQLDDVGEGRWPDGAKEVYQMPISTPRTTNRLFSICSVGPPGSNGVGLSWSTRYGKQYGMMRADSLTNGVWTNAFGVDINATGSMFRTNLDLSAPLGPQCYRIRQVN